MRSSCEVTTWSFFFWFHADISSVTNRKATPHIPAITNQHCDVSPTVTMPAITPNIVLNISTVCH